MKTSFKFKTIDGKKYKRYKTANSESGRDAAIKMAKRRYKSVRSIKPNLYGGVKYIIYVWGKK